MISRGQARISRGCFRGFLRACRPRSVVMCHPGFVDAELERLDPLTTSASANMPISPATTFPACCAAHGVALA